jgi:hypothetical protein
MSNRVGDTPEVKQALARAERCAKQAALAKTDNTGIFTRGCAENGSASLMDGV